MKGKDPLNFNTRSNRQEDRTKNNPETTDLLGGVSDAEMTRLFNMVMDFPLSAELRGQPLTVEEMAEAESPSYLEEDPPYGYRFPDQIELNAQGIHETMYDTLPEMDLILANECIL